MKVLAPVSGWVAPLDEVRDPVFSGRILGDGVAIDPIEGIVKSPCDGVVCMLAKHAVTVRTAGGAEILVHVGLDTVALKGEGFTALVEQGQAVRAGDPLLSFDLDFLAANGKSLLTPVILANGESFTVLRSIHGRQIAAGEFLMEIEPRSGSAAVAVGPAETASRTIIVTHEHGLHARPAAVLANEAKKFAGEVTLSIQGRSANAKSVAAIMGLGIGFRDEVRLTASGVGAQNTFEGLAMLLGQPSESAKPAPPSAPAANTASRFFGFVAAPGRAVGPAVRLRSDEIAVPEQGSGIAAETKALRQALAKVSARIAAEAATATDARGDILGAHVALLEDPGLGAAAVKHIEQGKSAAFAWRKSVRAMADVLRRLKDPRQRERAADLLDLERQVVAQLTGRAAARSVAVPPSAILIAEEFLPSDFSAIDPSKIAGLLSAGGGPTSHAAILASGMNIPALFGVGDAVLSIPDGTELLLDARQGFVEVAPQPGVAAAVRQAVAREAARHANDIANAGELCFTADGTRVEVFANLGKGAKEAASAIAMGAEGCGLLRTEFLFMDRATAPDETEQHAAYQAIADALDGRSFVLRTFDIGADKPVPYLAFPPEENPQLGLRGVRAGLAWPDILRTQLKAALQVKPAGRCKLLLPMVSSLSEVEAIAALIDELCGTAPRPELGVMIETPASAVLADQLLAKVDFVSIGTNDLTQYTLAIDRTHRTLSSQLDGLHPAVLRLIARTAEAADAALKPAAVCGGLAADPVAAPILIGLGIRELSVPAPAIPRLKAVIRGLQIESCRALARDALAQTSTRAVRALVSSQEEDTL